jgi:uncharacterized membrane-anchored protein YitT (DUF2179 family)
MRTVSKLFDGGLTLSISRIVYGQFFMSLLLLFNLLNFPFLYLFITKFNLLQFFVCSAVLTLEAAALPTEMTCRKIRLRLQELVCHLCASFPG